MQGRKTSPRPPRAPPPPGRSAGRRRRPGRAPRRRAPEARTGLATSELPSDTNPGFSSSQTSGSAWGWHSTSMAGSSPGPAGGRPARRCRRRRRPRRGRTRRHPGWPSSRRRSRPPPPMPGARPVRSAKARVTGPTGWVQGPARAACLRSMPTASTTGSDQVRVRGSSRASEEALDQSSGQHPGRLAEHVEPGRHQVDGLGEHLGLGVADPQGLEDGVGGPGWRRCGGRSRPATAWRRRRRPPAARPAGPSRSSPGAAAPLASHTTIPSSCDPNDGPLDRRQASGTWASSRRMAASRAAVHSRGSCSAQVG